ncbi:MAG: response regulator transcription factor [Saprospiraceae bacterium]|nr:response regulator transcription factor [Saprospiraceae bacterium]
MHRIFTIIGFLALLTTSILIAEEVPVDKINLAIRRSIDQMLRANNDSTSQIPIIHQINDTTWKTESISFLDYNKFPTLLQQSLELYNIKNSYQVAIRSCNYKEIFLGYISFDLNNTSPIPCQGRSRNDDCQIIEIQFTSNNFIDSKSKYKHLYYVVPIFIIFAGLIIVLTRKRQSILETKIQKPKNFLHFGQTKLDIETHQLICKNKIQKLTYREAKLLQYFVENQGKIIDREMLLQKVWGDEGIQVSRSLDVFVSRLRKFLQADQELQIATIHGVGYRLDLLTT